MTETYIKNTTNNSGTTAVRGELTFEDKVIEKIVGIAIEHVDGLLAVNGGFFSNLKNSVVNSDSVTDGVNVEVGKKQVAVDLDIVAEYQKHVPTIFADIKKVVEAEVKRMTDLEVVEVNVNVVDIKTRAQHEEDSVTLQDRVTSAAQATGEFASNQVSNVKSAVGSGVDKVEDMKSEPRVQ
ncbi:TPA: Asp23/Gls24 family envelope stress response protein [Streptococcus agalactiae]|uniref:Stress response regulator gls24 homolog n=1 Tax=Streptococcus agalactiae serotype V (strain ATCC BAA-611 / 2603 V/R) TaxID=208435 RepID=Q8DZG4_STRA5|nr:MULTISPECIES: Asp23/Gls24 family envelope stress response protein [Streptococcus]MEE3843927.1 Asp23/Gls24 family envelope stress response protein [Streptococcus sp. R4]AAN00019.1 gls24 protein, putative [Streptococcus agalactiae 2603V/R]AIX04901.1 asp23 family protein [Streptococcus agalactiae CNCTC 10/84]AYY68581.1 Asp23/Gls24 family envelope stress response protein [Streptococcus sp. FDAARGOS_521]EPT54347.1 stress response regulator Gls24 [Streptococcus agalactiae CCUG 25532]